MGAILKEIYTFVIDQYTIFENPIWNWIIFLLIDAIGFLISFRIVGDMYDSGDIDGSAIGSFFHWVFRFAIVTVIAAAFSTIIWLVRMIITYWLWIVIALAIVVTGLIVFFIIKRKRSRIEKVG